MQLSGISCLAPPAAPLPQPPTDLRICSLLPSATDIVGCLGLASRLVCVTHECDTAPDAATLAAALDSKV